MTYLELTKAALSSMLKDVVEDQKAKKIRASGASAESLVVTMNNEGGELRGADYIYFQVMGRKPGKFPPIQSIIEWIEAKGIQPQDISVKSLAFLIARKISKLGTNIFMGTSPALAFEIIVKDNTEQLGEDVGVLAAQEILDIFKTLETR